MQRAERGFTERDVKWAAQECSWQVSGEMSVWWMLTGLQFARDTFPSSPMPTLADVITVGQLVEPNVNREGFRRVGVRVGSSIKPDWLEVPDLLDDLISRPPKEPKDYFEVFEEIHPFRDGNGRTGNILYNWVGGTLDKVIFPPNLWDDWRRYDGPPR